LRVARLRGGQDRIASDANCGVPGVMAIDPMRVRMACAELKTPLGVPFKTAWAVIAALPSRTPLTRPPEVTVARVVSEEDHWKVTPVTVVEPDFAVAVSWRVPASTTVESPSMTTEVIVGGPPPPPSPPPQPATANPPNRARPQRRIDGASPGKTP
jgi:hypothetical protein